MPSVMAIVSKAVFEKLVEKTVGVGHLVDTDRYSSTPAAFEQLGKRDAIFLVTVRPPKEALWLVAILEAPKQQGKGWIGKRNKTPIRDVTTLVKQLRFASGKGIEAKQGALAMSLQTPRILTDADVALLRGEASPAVSAYRKQVDATPAGQAAKRQAAAVAGGRFRFENHRKPFAMLKQLRKPQYKQLAQMTANNDAGKPEQCVKDEDWAPMELVDVVELATGKPIYQLYVWPYGSGTPRPRRAPPRHDPRRVRGHPAGRSRGVPREVRHALRHPRRRRDRERPHEGSADAVLRVARR